jgi:hypothetical protein
MPEHQRAGRFERSQDLDLAIARQRHLRLFHRHRHVPSFVASLYPRVPRYRFVPARREPLRRRAPPRARRRRPALQLLKNGVEAREARFPARSISLEPGTRFGKRFPLETTRPPLRILADRNQPGTLENFQVLRDRGLTDRERFGELRHRRLAALDRRAREMLHRVVLTVESA